VANINGKTFIASSNNMHLQNISFKFSNDESCDVTFHINASKYEIVFSAGAWKEGKTDMPEPALTGNFIENNSMINPAKIAAGYTWKGADTLELILRYIESPHTETFTCHFHDNKLTMEAARSYDYGKNKTVIEAEAK